MLAKRIIPCLDVDKGRVVKGKKFQNIRDVADPVELAKRYNEAGADELVFYDITASNEERNIFLDVVEKVASEVTIPFTVGGGIRTVEDIHKVLRSGADKVSINSAAVNNPDLIEEAALKFGSQCIVLSIDAKQNDKNQWEVYTNGGRYNTSMDAIDWAIQGEKLGAGEIVVNVIDTDGEKSGYNLELTKIIAESVNIPIVASGGAGQLEHFSQVLQPGYADAALAASVFHYEEISIPELKKHLADNGIDVRRDLSWK
ncbi:imidazole glycerol phosphate synthase subunit HisF [Virgibacillus profundi]|uniref:Imidazole glycerol phosphate synthase subunit HisF n=1 Tax=Virgibacillus profundi TaxID=2024555 RepID=A0A2A2IGZ3_9BACI|nr:imidazole glycerol phosphate synthase subunit HisF [Virgibacillus profundi]PAV30586.1 imidazole glycerol phosphate synthase subunit HisF [Virgibacillus profundi]PXY54758.1 imidazole glycerol phosphate synthase subunit HisF [Virgibacillus profundi]